MSGASVASPGWRPLVLAVLVASSLAAAGCGRGGGEGKNRAGAAAGSREAQPVPAWQQPGPMGVPERLALIAADEANQMIWFRLPGMIDGLRRDAEKAGDPKKEMAARLRLGMALVQMGATDDGLAALDRAMELGSGIGLAKDSQELRGIRFWLGVAHLRQGEQDNCFALHAPDACLMPIGGSGVHVNSRGSRAAVADFEALLADEPENLGHRWLLNLAYQTLGEYPGQVLPGQLIPPSAFESGFDIGRFPNVAHERGVDAPTLAGGSSLEDFDLDGDLDLLASTIDVKGAMQYFVNDGTGHFTDATAASGLSVELGGESFEVADYDNDGDPDVFVTRGGWMGTRGRHPNSLLRNDGNGAFTDVTVEAGLLSFHPTQQSDWGDFDNDGWIDLYVGNESSPGRPEPCELFRNRGDGTFEEVAARAGVSHAGYVKGVAWGDIDNDGRLDLYLSQDSGENVLFHNDGPAGPAGDGRIWKFSDVTKNAGVGLPLHSYPVMFFDFDNDGWEDLFVSSWLGQDVETDAAAAKDRAKGRDKIDSSPILLPTVHDALKLPVPQEWARLYRNNRDGTFTDVAKAMNVDHPLLGMGMNFGDLDNDGWLDFYVGTGNPSLSTLVPNKMYRNDAGKRFQDVTTSGGFGHVQKGHGVAWGDIEGDGDQDVVVILGGTWAGDAARKALFLNPGHGNRWITLRLEGTKSNRAGIGARIEAVVATPRGERAIRLTAGTGGSFGNSSLQQEMGLGDATAIRRIEIRWPSGAVQSLPGVPMDGVYSVREGDAAARPVRASASAPARP